MDGGQCDRVLLYWRKPSLLPDSVKSARRPTVEAVATMACALTVVDFFRSAVARRRCASTAAALSGPLRLRQWLSADQHHSRRAAYYATMRVAFTATIAVGSRVGGRWGKLMVECPPAETYDVSFMPAPAAATGKLQHHEDLVILKGYKVRNTLRIQERERVKLGCWETELKKSSSRKRLKKSFSRKKAVSYYGAGLT